MSTIVGTSTTAASDEGFLNATTNAVALHGTRNNRSKRVPSTNDATMIIQNLEEHLWRPIDYPDGFKPNLKLDSNSVKRYDGSSKFLDLELGIGSSV